jgi:hypothetical protein
VLGQASETMFSDPGFGQIKLGQTLPGYAMVHRLALGSPYSKPSTATAEDGLLHPNSRWRFGLT